jgi:hypothetical protein
MVGRFVVAAGVTAAAAPAAFALGTRPRMLSVAAAAPDGTPTLNAPNATDATTGSNGAPAGARASAWPADGSEESDGTDEQPATIAL